MFAGVSLLGRPSVAWLLAAFYLACVLAVLWADRFVSAGRRTRVHDRLLWACSGALLVSGAIHCASNALGPAHWAEQLATAVLPLVWLLTQRVSFQRASVLALARLGIVVAFLAHAALFFDWQAELGLLGRLLVANLGLGWGITHGLMLGLAGLYAAMGLALALAGWFRGVDRLTLGAAVTLGAFTAGIRICLGLEPGFFQASALHWVFSTLLGAAAGCLPLFLALCADQRSAARIRRASSGRARAEAARRPGPLSAA